MIGDILEQLDEQLETFLQRWNHHLQQSGYAEFSFVQRGDSSKAFHALLSLLRELDASDISPVQLRNQLQNPPCFFVDMARQQRRRGVTCEMCIGCFKAMRHATDELIDAIISNEMGKIATRKRLQQLSDATEAVLIADAEYSDSREVSQELQQANRQLIREKNTYESIFEATSNLVLLTDEQGAIIEANPQAKVFFSGVQIFEVFCGTLLRLPCASLDELLQRFPPHQEHEISLMRDHFSQVFNLQILPLSKTSLSSQGIMLLLSDITCMVDHRQALELRVTERTQALANSEKMLDAIFQSVGKGILLIDSDREIVKANQQASEIFGIPLEVLIGTPFCTLTDMDGCRKLTEISEDLIEGQRRSVEVTSLYVDGKTFPSEITITRMDLDGQRFWPVIVRDTTQQRALENGLREEKLQSEEMNVTLRNVLKSIESDRRDFEQNLTHRIRSGLLPGLEKIRNEQDEVLQSTYLDMLKGQLVALTTGFENELDADLLKLSKSELKICRYIKAGLTGKEICDTMNLSFETIQTHRKNIRKKLGLRGKEVNLHTFLANRNCNLGSMENG